MNETVKFMQFVINHSYQQLFSCFLVTGAPIHLRAKYHALNGRYPNDSNSTAFIRWYKELSSDNKQRVINKAITFKL